MPSGMTNTAPRPFAFVVMPFAPSFDDTYELAIKPACDDAGAYTERVDEQIFHENILHRTYNQIEKADLVVADLTGRNVNVFYETGYAHARRKQLVMLARDVADVPFDTRAYPPIIYREDLVYLKRELEQRVRRLLETRAGVSSPFAVPVDVTVNGRALSPLVTQDVPGSIRAYKEFGSVHFTAVVQNSVARFLRPIEMRFGVITPREHKSVIREGKVEQALNRDGTWLQLLRQDFRLLPGSWQKYWMTIQLERKYEEGELIGPFTIRILTSSGYFDFPFRLKIAGETQ